jgi:dTDP-4-dehydrorhamnose 3,5-epimerase
MTLRTLKLTEIVADPSPTLLDLTLAAATADKQMVTADGTPVGTLPDGAWRRDSVTQFDDRGSITEVFDSRWKFTEEPVEFVYCWTLLPGVVKGWALHKRHEDRYFLLRGTVEVLFYDVRPGSVTYGKVSKTVMSQGRPGLMRVPRNVWHADRNIGTTEAIILNLPTIPYDHAAPDKYRLPLDTPLIPFSFGNATGY